MPTAPALLAWIPLLVTLGGAGPTRAAGGTLVVLDKSEARVALIDPASGEVRRSLPCGVGPHEAATSPDGRTLVVCDYGQSEPGSTLTVIDLEHAEVVRTISLGEHRRPHGIAYQSDGRHVVVTSEASRALLRIDVEEAKVTDVFPTEAQLSHMVVLSADGSRAFVANIGSGSVTAIDLVEGGILAQIETGAGAEGIAITPDGKQVWVTNREADSVSVIDAEWLEVRASLECAKFPIRVKFTPDGRYALVSNANSGDVAVFEVAERKEVARIPMGLTAVEGEDARLFGDRFGTSPVPVGILIEPGGQRAYVANTNADLVTVLDLDSWKVTGRIAPGREPDGMAWSVLPPPAAKPSAEGDADKR